MLNTYNNRYAGNLGLGFVSPLHTDLLMNSPVPGTGGSSSGMHSITRSSMPGTPAHATFTSSYSSGNLHNTLNIELQQAL
jgi:hypothetical protein